MNEMRGIHAVLYALFDAYGALDRSAMRLQVEHVKSAGVDGIVVLGLATEVSKLSLSEQLDIINWASEDIAGELPLTVTVSGNSVEAQRNTALHSLDRGAECLILQPPSAGNYSGATYVDFFAKVADQIDAKFAVQNAPQYLGSALTNAQLSDLRKRNPGFSVVKAETSATDLASLIRELGTDVSMMNGRGGLEMTDCLRAGATGFILAPDLVDHSKVIFDLWQSDQQGAAEKKYAEILPAIVFMMQSIEHLICYGKRIFGYRTGIDIHDRAPAINPTSFGLQCAEQWAQMAGPYQKSATGLASSDNTRPL